MDGERHRCVDSREDGSSGEEKGVVEGNGHPQSSAEEKGVDVVNGEGNEHPQSGAEEKGVDVVNGKGNRHPQSSAEEKGVDVVNGEGNGHPQSSAEEQGTNSTEDVPPDDHAESASAGNPRKRERWELLPFVIASNTLSGINHLFFSMLYVELVSYFQLPTATLGWPDSIHKWTALFSGILLSAPIQRYGSRLVATTGGVVMAIGIGSSCLANSVVMLCLCYGLVGGLGQGMVYLSTVVTLQQNFQKNRTLANAFAQCGLTVGYVLGPLWTKFLLQTYGWRGGFLLHAGLMLQTTLLATQFHPAGGSSKTPNSETKRAAFKMMLKTVMDFSLFKNPCFVLFCAGHFLHKFCQCAIWLVLPNSIVVSGGTLEQAAYIMSTLGGFMFVGRLATGFVANTRFVNRIAMFGVTTILGSACVMLLAAYDAFIWMIALVVLNGLSYGGANMLAIAILPEVFGVEKIARSSALTFAVFGISAMLAPPFAGWLFDITGTYDATVLVCGALGILGGFLYLLMLLVEKLQQTKTKRLGNDINKDVRVVPMKEQSV